MSPGRLIGLATLLLTGCSYTFSREGDDFVLIGKPVDFSDAPRARQSPSQNHHLMFGRDASPWVVLSDQDLTGLTDVQEVQLAPPFDVQSEGGTFLAFTPKTYYGLVEHTDTPSSLIIHLGGGSRNRLDVDPGPGRLTLSPKGNAFFWVPNTPGTTQRFGSIDITKNTIVSRGLPPNDPPWISVEFDPDGEELVVFGSDGLMRGFSTHGDTSVLLGAWRPADPLALSFAPRVIEKALVSCTPAGIELHGFDGTLIRLLVVEHCRADRPFAAGEGFVYYVSDERLRSISVDGKHAPRDLGPYIAERRLLAAGGGNVATAELAQGQSSAGPAWVGEQKIMERGRELRFSRDGQKVRFLEHAATLEGVGDLYSVSVDGGERVLLARNVHRYAELPDGRVLAATNQAFIGPHNRVVVIDEEARTATYVAGAARDFEAFPDGERALVGLVPEKAGGAIDWTVVPISPRTLP